MAAVGRSLFFSSAQADSREDSAKGLSTTKIPSAERISNCTAALAGGIHGGFFARRAYLLRGTAYFENGDFEAAIADFSKVIQLFRRDVQASNQGGAASYRRRDFA